MDPVRIGIIGAGGVAGIHLEALEGVDEIEVLAVADINGDAAERTAAKWRIPGVHRGTEELLARDDIEGVMVCTPTAIHAGPAIAAMRAGKHVFVEKPMEASLAAAAEMVRTAEETGRILQVGLKLRFTRQVQVAKKLIADGTLGGVYYAETVADRRRATPGHSF